MEISFFSASPEETERFAASLVVDGTVGKGSFVALTGGLGAGKTVFARGIVRGVFSRFGGTDRSGSVQSPTFALINVYDCAFPVWHCDFYRIRGEDDLYMTGFDDCPFGEVAVVAEWSESIPFAVPENALHVDISAEGEGRRITVRRG